jgi:pyruvate dehydrogenase E1 component alpha subunit
MRKDPIAQLERQLRDQGYLDDAELQAMDREIMAALEAAVAFAEASPFPTAEQATDDVFAPTPASLASGEGSGRGLAV